MTPSSRQEIGLGMVSGLFSRALGVRVKGRSGGLKSKAVWF